MGAREALDGLRTDLGRMWEEAERSSFAGVRWQLSQIHLCADVARLVIVSEDLDRMVSRSRKVGMHVPAQRDAWALLDIDLGNDLGNGAEGIDAAFVRDDLWMADEAGESWAMPADWAGVPLDVLEGMPIDATEGTPEGEEGEYREERPADELGMSVHLWGRRVSGVSFSPGGDLSAVLYDKLLEERLSGKRWIEVIHRAGGWRDGMPLTRVEARFRRGALRELMALQGASVGYSGAGVDNRRDEVCSFDDPWIALEHLDDLWAYFAGLPPESDAAPDVTSRGWLRMAMADASVTR